MRLWPICVIGVPQRLIDRAHSTGPSVCPDVSGRIEFEGTCRTNKYPGILLASAKCLAAVAQLDRVLGYEPRGRGFESCQPHQIASGSRY
jgi:hypothetical protein